MEGSKKSKRKASRCLEERVGGVEKDQGGQTREAVSVRLTQPRERQWGDLIGRKSRRKKSPLSEARKREGGNESIAYGKTGGAEKARTNGGIRLDRLGGSQRRNRREEKK